MIDSIRKDIFKIFQADKCAGKTESVFLKHGLIDCLGCRPDKKNQGNDNLGGHQKIGQDFVFENDSFFHGLARDGQAGPLG